MLMHASDYFRYPVSLGAALAVTFLAACSIFFLSNTVEGAGLSNSPSLIQDATMNASVRYRFTELPTPGYGRADSINSHGQITGTMIKPGTAGLIFLWEEGKMREIGILPGKTASFGSGINRNGHIVGRASNGGDAPFDPPFAVIWRDGKLTRLFSDTRMSSAAAINDNDAVVGDMIIGRLAVVDDKSARQVIEHAFLWRHGKVTDLGTLQGDRSQARDINNRDQVVGFSDHERTFNHAFLWDTGKMHDLGTLGGKQSDAYGINDQTQVVGGAETTDGQYHAFLWDKGVLHDLGSPGPGLCHAEKINNQGQVVGSWWPEGKSFQESHALLWEHGQRMDLNDLIPKNTGWLLTDAYDINDQGQIVGAGMHNGSYQAFLLTPIRSTRPVKRLDRFQPPHYPG